MATGNFYIDGNHGLNVIHTDYEEATEDTIANIVSELSSKGYSVDHIYLADKTPRSFETGQNFAVFNNNNKVVAILVLCAGYYDGANINIYTDELLTDEYERNEITFNKRDIARVVKCVEMYTEGYKRTAVFSNGETMYEKGK